MQIKVFRVICKHCEASFYEMEDDEVKRCPHCKRDTSEAEDAGYILPQITVNPITGEISIVPIQKGGENK